MQVLSKSILAVTTLGLLVSYQNCSEVADSSSNLKSFTKSIPEEVLVDEEHDISKIHVRSQGSFHDSYVILDLESQTYELRENGGEELAIEIDWEKIEAARYAQRLCKGGRNITISYLSYDVITCFTQSETYELEVKNSISGQLSADLWNVSSYYRDNNYSIYPGDNYNFYLNSNDQNLCDKDANNNLIAAIKISRAL